MSIASFSSVNFCDPKKKADVVRGSLSTYISPLRFPNAAVSRTDINNFLYLNPISKDILKLRFNSWNVFVSLGLVLFLFPVPFIKGKHLQGKVEAQALCKCGVTSSKSPLDIPM